MATLVCTELTVRCATQLQGSSSPRCVFKKTKLKFLFLTMCSGDCGGGGRSASLRVPGFARLPGCRLQHKVFGHHPERPRWVIAICSQWFFVHDDFFVHLVIMMKREQPETRVETLTYKRQNLILKMLTPVFNPSWVDLYRLHIIRGKSNIVQMCDCLNLFLCLFQIILWPWNAFLRCWDWAILV